MFRRSSAPHLSSPNVPEARRAGGSFFTRSARPLIGKRAFSKPERIYFRGIAWSAAAGASAMVLVASLGSDWLITSACFGAIILTMTKAFDGRLDLKEYHISQIEHATAVQTDLHLDNAALRQELVFANLSLAEYRRYIQFLAAGQVGGAEGDELCGESPSAGNVVPFRRMH